MSRSAAPWDVAVVGAGPAGSVCAASVRAASSRSRVALIDRDTFPRDKTCGDAVAVVAARILRDLGMGEVLAGRPRIWNRAYAVSADQKLLVTAISQTMEALEERAKSDGGHYIVERARFDDSLCRGAIARGAADWTGHDLTDAAFDESAGLWTLSLRRPVGETVQLRCRMLVGADGAGSKVRRVAGVAKSGAGHTLLGLRAYAEAEGLPDETLRFDFLRSLIPGYGWVFPLLGDRINLGVVVDRRDYRKKPRPLRAWFDEYLDFLREDGVVVRNVRGVRTHPLPLASEWPPLVPERQLALIGDAASMINPLTGEGIHYGVQAGYTLGNAVGRCFEDGENLSTALDSWAADWKEEFGESIQADDVVRIWARFWRVVTAPRGAELQRVEAAPEEPEEAAALSC